MKRFLWVILVVIVVVLTIWLGQSFFSNPQSVQAQAENEEVDEPVEQNPDKSNLEPTTYTPANYRPPLYDPFSNQYREGVSFEERIEALDTTIRTPPTINITFQTNPTTIADVGSGTIATIFTFRANVSGDNTTQVNRLQVRWDFESDGEWDSHFSRTRTVRHTFPEPGRYTVLAQVLDLNGRLFHDTQDILIVQNTSPQAHFTVRPTGGTSAKVFTFNTNTSTDSQYRRTSLSYRFDWDGDGAWDTPFQLRNIWNHRFEQPGVYNVTMEVQDPEGLTDTFSQELIVTQNQPPTANLTYSVEAPRTTQTTATHQRPAPQQIQSTQGVPRQTYRLDASGSHDPEDGTRLRYRWDLNYTGRNDINFDTAFSSSAVRTITIPSGERRTVRVQVQDSDGAIDEMVVEIE